MSAPRTIIQTALAGTDFDGSTTGSGVVDFSDIPLESDEVPIIFAIALSTPSGSAVDIALDIRLTRPGGGTTERITIIQDTETDFSQAGCEIPVPTVVVDAPNVYTPWVLRCTTVKAANVDCSFIVSYTSGRVLRG